jgi:hypothetical protein
LPDLDALRTPHIASVRDDVLGHLDPLAANGTLVTMRHADMRVG